MTQHEGLSRERWAAFSLDQQILMIANEMHRAAKLGKDEDRQRLEHSYERVLQLVDLTIGSHGNRNLVRELLRWRGLVAELYLTRSLQRERHGALLRCLLGFTPTAFRQVAQLFPASGTS